MKLVNTLIILSALGTFLYTWIDSGTNSNVIEIMQNGITVTQEFQKSVGLQNVLTHNLIMRFEECGYFNKIELGADCDNAKSSYTKAKFEFENQESISKDSQQRYNDKINKLTDTYDTRERWKGIFFLFALSTNIAALVFNQKENRKITANIINKI